MIAGHKIKVYTQICDMSFGEPLRIT